MYNIGDRLKELREEKGLTVEEYADQINFVKSIIWSYELGKKKPSLNHIERIAEFFNVSAEYLLTGDQKVS
ncbi:hypothetical protein CIL05_02745 [Virgibacillus profundi]|uniref:HTH cro/C1-type domain-containing protein n=1 Tax=Virgibacillus profundi TaxID=2024555 RepID=A0A2A2IJZ8_9BACI|nr:helix-turn-helix transcriptional regulator [Virgibacillus profundi]PAV31594.1 hypothetical protein CIL05_02745 [Virgibacillus profundi]PXY55780.1 XRE family transcriptional regulator [Virgibacillus profundi]